MKYKTPKSLKGRRIHTFLLQPRGYGMMKAISEKAQEKAVNGLLKNHDQSHETTEKFLRDSALYKLMTNEPNRVWWKEELRWHFDSSDRAIRKDLAELANYAPVVALSSTKGYRVVKLLDSQDETSLEADLETVNHQLNELMSRSANLKARMKPLMGLKAEIEKRLKEKEG